MHGLSPARWILRLCLLRFQGNIRDSQENMRLTVLRGATKLLLALLLLSALIAQKAPGQRPTGAGTQNAHDPAPAPARAPDPSPVPPGAPTAPPAQKTTLAEFAWLAGHWQGSWGPRLAQQAWMPPKAGVMLGTFQLAENDKTLVLEVFTLTEETNGIELRIRHLTPSLVAWEKSGAIVLNLASTDSKSAVFENPMNGQPKRAVFTRLDADTFVSRSEIIAEKGDMQVTEITYHRMRETPPGKSKR
jgi:hypothetical protein